VTIIGTDLYANGSHIHLVGHYHFEEPEIVGHLRPLRVKRHEDDLGA